MMSPVLLEPDDTIVAAYTEVCRRAKVEFWEQDHMDYVHSAYTKMFSPARSAHSRTLPLAHLIEHWLMLARAANVEAAAEARGHIPLEDAHSTEADVAQAPERKVAFIKGLLRGLPQASKKIMYLLVIERATEREVAIALGLSQGSVRRLYDQGVQRLQEIAESERLVA